VLLEVAEVVVDKEVVWLEALVTKDIMVVAVVVCLQQAVVEVLEEMEVVQPEVPILELVERELRILSMEHH